MSEEKNIIAEEKAPRKFPIWVRHLAAALVFVLLAGILLTGTSYLFRNTTTNRNAVTGIKEADGVDVVCVGSSSTLRYYQPFLAWEEYGFTTYDLATESGSPPLMLGEVKTALKEQDPKLLVIDARVFAQEKFSFDAYREAGVRNATDSMDYSPVRDQTILSSLDYYGTDENTDYVAYFLDLVKYHGQTERLGQEENWKYVLNSSYNATNGYNPRDVVQYMSDPGNYLTDERAELDESIAALLTELLDYLKEQDVEVLFVQVPIIMNTTTMKRNNTIGDMVTAYGFDYVDCNRLISEIGIDYETDFDDALHVNALGAEKYTRYITDYLKENFDLEDHRGQSGYEAWDEMAAASREIYEPLKQTVLDTIDEMRASHEKALSLKDVTDPYEWMALVNDDHYTIFMITDGSLTVPGLPWTLSEEGHEGVAIYADGEKSYEMLSAAENPHTGFVGVKGKLYSVNTGDQASLKIDNQEFYTEKYALELVVFDNYYSEVADCVILSGNADNVTLQHLN